MNNTHVSQLIPSNEQEGWRWLVGHRRYRHAPSATGNAWIRSFLSGAGLEILGGDPRLLNLKAIRFSDFLITHAHGPELHVRWSRRRVPAQTRYLMLFVNRGVISVEGNAAHWWSDEDDGLCIVFPGTEPVELRSTEYSEAILFTFDSNAIAPYLVTPSNVGDVRGSATVLRASYAYLQAAVDVPHVAEHPEEATDVLRTLTREVARALTKSFLVTDRFDAYFFHAQRVIDEQSIDPELDVAVLAALCQISRRSLDRIYKKRGLSAAREIRRSRAQRAISLLSDGGTRTLKDVASASGFGSITTMNRALNEIYGLSAAAIRDSPVAPTVRQDSSDPVG